MINLEIVDLDGAKAIGVSVELPQTRALTISTERGYISAGHMDLPFLEGRHPERKILAARVTNVRSIADLLEAKVYDCTPAATAAGVEPGMTGRAALLRMV